MSPDIVHGEGIRRYGVAHQPVDFRRKVPYWPQPSRALPSRSRAMARRPRAGLPGIWHTFLDRAIAKPPCFETRSDKRCLMTCWRPRLAPADWRCTRPARKRRTFISFSGGGWGSDARAALLERRVPGSVRLRIASRRVEGRSSGPAMLPPRRSLPARGQEGGSRSRDSTRRTRAGSRRRDRAAGPGGGTGRGSGGPTRAHG